MEHHRLGPKFSELTEHRMNCLPEQAAGAEMAS